MFRLPERVAPNAKIICIVGDFNKWDTNDNPMQKLKNGDYIIAFNLELGREYQFRYLVGKPKWLNDRNSDKYNHLEEFLMDCEYGRDHCFESSISHMTQCSIMIMSLCQRIFYFFIVSAR